MLMQPAKTTCRRSRRNVVAGPRRADPRGSRCRAARAHSRARRSVEGRWRRRRGDRSQRVRADRQRRYRHRPGQAHRVRAGSVHGLGDPGGRRIGRRLVADAGRACARQRRSLQEPRVRHAGHRRLDRDRQLVRADAHRRRDRAGHAGRGGRRMPGRCRLARSRSNAASSAMRRPGAKAASAQFADAAAKLPVPDQGAAQGPLGVPPDRQRRRLGQEARQRREVERHGAVHDRHP